MDVQITLQTPFPGTVLHRQLSSEERLLKERGWSAYSLFDLTYRPDKMTVAELEVGFRHVLTRVYSSEATTRRKNIRTSIMRKRRRLKP